MRYQWEVTLKRIQKDYQEHFRYEETNSMQDLQMNQTISSSSLSTSEWYSLSQQLPLWHNYSTDSFVGAIAFLLWMPYAAHQELFLLQSELASLQLMPASALERSLLCLDEAWTSSSSNAPTLIESPAGCSADHDECTYYTYSIKYESYKASCSPDKWNKTSSYCYQRIQWNLWVYDDE